jgi:hypothetical protein
LETNYFLRFGAQIDFGTVRRSLLEDVVTRCQVTPHNCRKKPWTEYCVELPCEPFARVLVPVRRFVPSSWNCIVWFAQHSLLFWTWPQPVHGFGRRNPFTGRTPRWTWPQPVHDFGRRNPFTGRTPRLAGYVDFVAMEADDLTLRVRNELVQTINRGEYQLAFRFYQRHHPIGTKSLSKATATSLLRLRNWNSIGVSRGAELLETFFYPSRGSWWLVPTLETNYFLRSALGAP